jgi:hypothetical protein
MQESVNEAEDYAWEILSVVCWGDEESMQALETVRELYFGRWQTIEELKTKLRGEGNGSSNDL